MRVAAVDLGTNTTRLLVADVGDGALDALERHEQITSLGEGVDARRRLLPLPIARVRNALGEYRRRIEELGAERVLCVATSAVRDAENGEAFLGEIEWSYGFATRLLAGEEEARLTFAGATLGRDDLDGVMVVDIGGGSTELVLPDSAVSMDVGSVRLTEQFGEDRAAMAEAVRAALPDLHPTRAIGVAGTIMSLAALDLDLARYQESEADGHSLGAAKVATQVDELAALSLGNARTSSRSTPSVRRSSSPARSSWTRSSAATSWTRSRRANATCSTERPSKRRGYQRPRKAKPRPAPTSAVESDERPLVLGQPALQDGAAQHADEASSVDYRDALCVVLLEEPEGRLQVRGRVDRVVRLLGDLAQRRLAWMPAGSDDLAH